MLQRLTVAIVLVLIAAACGGGDVSDTTGDAGQASDTTSTQAPETTTAPAETTPTTEADAGSAVDAPELGGTSWMVTDYRLPNGSITNVWKTEVTIAFSTDGTVSGSAGCNDYQGAWSVSGAYDEFESGVRDPNDGQELTLDSLSWTEIGCEDEAIMEQESEILDILQRAGRWVLIDGNFNLRDEEGSFLFEAEPA